MVLLEVMVLNRGAGKAHQFLPHELCGPPLDPESAMMAWSFPLTEVGSVRALPSRWIHAPTHNIVDKLLLSAAPKLCSIIRGGTVFSDNQRIVYGCSLFACS